MDLINIQHVETKIGELIIGSYSGKLCLLDFKDRKNRLSIDNRLKKGLKTEFSFQDDEIIGRTYLQLTEFLLGKRKEFDLPLQFVGTDFQKEVWNGILRVPFGKTISYLELAKSINREKAVRAVANATRDNAIAIIIGCHRIIGSNGKLTGYAGGLRVKEQLLNLEMSV